MMVGPIYWNHSLSFFCVLSLSLFKLYIPFTLTKEEDPYSFSAHTCKD